MNNDVCSKNRHRISPASVVSPSRSGCLSFRLMPAQDLPTIANTQTIGSLILGKNWWAAYVSRIARLRTAHRTTYFAGVCYRTYGMLAAVQYSGRWWLILSPILLFPSVLSMTLSMRYAFIRQLARSFDFWFFFAANVVWTVSLFIAYQDSRVVICFITFIELEASKMIDANAQRLPIIAVALLLNAITLTVSTIGIAVDVIHIHDVVVWRTPTGYVLRLEDVLLNAMATVIVLLLRIAYNRRDAWRNKGDCYVRCVTLRCRLTFSKSTVLEATTTTSRLMSHETMIGPVQVLPKPPMKLSMIKLQCVIADEIFPVHRVVGGDKLSRYTPEPWLLNCWVVVCIGALVATTSLANAQAFHAWLAPLTLSLTVCSVSPFIALQQTQLLRHLFRSFDFMFLLFQVISTGFCMCHLLDWDTDQCVVVVCIVSWFYVMVTYDALLPPAKQVLQWSPSRAAVLALFLIGMHVLLGVQLLFDSDWGIRDRVLIDVVVFGHRLRVFVIPLILSRLLILVIYKCRLVWRLVRRSRRPGGEMELITLQGAVHYKRQRSMVTRNVARQQ